MTKYLYEELAVKKLNPVKLPIELAYSVPYLAQADRVIGSEVITFRPIKINKN